MLHPLANLTMLITRLLRKDCVVSVVVLVIMVVILLSVLVLGYLCHIRIISDLEKEHKLKLEVEKSKWFHDGWEDGAAWGKQHGVREKHSWNQPKNY